jgi:hypothetical protein
MSKIFEVFTVFLTLQYSGLSLGAYFIGSKLVIFHFEDKNTYVEKPL